jgi:hypothetical protein
MKDSLNVILNQAVKDIAEYYASGEPLDGDETEEIAKEFLSLLNTNNGNI